MSLATGTRLGPYEVLAPVGQGGMGEVYRARDTRLSRDVALKILPEAFAHDPERLARFQREAQVLASLNHPNIAHVYGLEEGGGVRALVMELVEGPTLADRIAPGPMPVDEAIPIASQIGEALEAAHEQGIIHRDLKPANVKVRPDGTVKVLDFGLAKAIEAGSAPGGSSSPTITTPAMTQAGIVLGTAAYMSPEQAKGRAADKRSDIWAWGCVLYEMLTGSRAFPGNEVAETLAKVIEREPDLNRLPVATPSAIRRVLQRCLAKERKQRLADIADVQLDLHEALTSSVPDVVGPSPAVQAGTRPWLISGFGGFVAGGALIGAAIWLFAGGLTGSPDRPVRRLTITVPPDAPLIPASRGPGGVALSPDGTELVYVALSGGTRRLYRRALDQLDVRPIPGTEHGVQPFFSPDGEWVAYFSVGADRPYTLKKVSLRGGSPQTLCNVGQPAGGSWGSDDTIVFAAGAGNPPASNLFRVRAAGGTPEVVASPDASAKELRYAWPHVIQGSREVLFSVSTSVRTGDSDFSEAHIAALSLESGQSHHVVDQGYHPQYVPSGHIVYVSEGTLMAVPFDLGRFEAAGPAVPVQEAIDTVLGSGAANLAFADDGSFLYIPGTDPRRMPSAKLAWVSPDGRDIQPIPTDLLEGPRYLSLSPDGQRLVLGVGPDNAANLWVYDLTGRPPTPLTHRAHNMDPVWTRDGTRIVFSSNREGVSNLFWIAADGTELEPERLLTGPYGQYAGSWTPGDRELLFWNRDNPASFSDIRALTMGKDRRVRDVIASEYREGRPRLSPDGRWLAYFSNVSGRQEIWVQPYPGPGAPVRVSVNGGAEPVWAPDGLELFYLERLGAGDRRIMGARFTETNSTGSFAPPSARVESVVTLPGTNGFFDVAPDGRFIVLQNAETEGQATGAPPFVVVLNWLDELKERVTIR